MTIISKEKKQWWIRAVVRVITMMLIAHGPTVVWANDSDMDFFDAAFLERTSSHSPRSSLPSTGKQWMGVGSIQLSALIEEAIKNRLDVLSILGQPTVPATDKGDVTATRNFLDKSGFEITLRLDHFYDYNNANLQLKRRLVNARAKIPADIVTKYNQFLKDPWMHREYSERTGVKPRAIEILRLHAGRLHPTEFVELLRKPDEIMRRSGLDNRYLQDIETIQRDLSGELN